MDGLVIGLDLCDVYTQISCFGQEKSFTIPTVICKKKNCQEWYVGEEGYGYTLMGEGIIVDKLLNLVMKDGTATIEQVKYQGIDLLFLFLKKVLELSAIEFGTLPVLQLVIALQSIDGKMMESLQICARQLGLAKEQFHIISYPESFSYYVLSQKKDIWSNQVGMFDLSEERLRYYELKAQRGIRKMTVFSEYESLEDGFNLDILKTVSGAKLADKILCSFGERVLQKKLFSSVFLTGKGFENRDWALEFMKLICSRRKVFIEPDVFSKGAALKGREYLENSSENPYVLICEGRLNVSVSIKVLYKEKESQLVIVAAGESWYETDYTVDLIVDKQKDVEMLITPLDSRRYRTVKIPLEGFPKRPDRTTRIQVSIGFLDERTMTVTIKDKGFGELFPASDAMVKQEVMI